MPRYELLNNVTHKDLRVVTRFGREYGDEVGLVPAFPTEFAELQREYPIFLRKDRDSGDWQAVALLGFESNENLFLHDGRWNANYLPGYVARGPFLIGFQQQNIDGELRNEPVIHVDMDHPRIRQGEAEAAQAVFLPHGGNSAYLEHITAVLRGIRDGADAGKAIFAAFDELGLIQPMKIELKFDEEHGADLTGLHGIDRDRLAALDAEALHRLHRSGYLEGAYLILASTHNLRRLMAEKQRRLRQQDAAAA
ncbi:SapC family protein [Pseudoxanthomonas wuyuanensis]